MVIDIYVFHCQLTLCQIRLKMRKIFSSARVNTLLMSVYRNMATQNIELSLRYSNMDVLKILTKI